MNQFWQKFKEIIGGFRHQETPERRPPVDVEYKEFVYRIQPRSSFRTPLQADTLWAALMWTHAYMHGDPKKTSKLVHAEVPQILVSDGFPYRYLPKPKNYIPIERVEAIVEKVLGSSWEKKLMGIEIAKRLSEQQLLPVQLVNDLVSGKKSEEDLLRELLQVEWCPKKFIKTQTQLLKSSESQEISDRIGKYCNDKQCDAVTTWTDSHKSQSHWNCARILNSESLNHLTLIDRSRVRKNRINRFLMRAMEENGLFSQEEDDLSANLWWIFVKVHPEFDEGKVQDLFRKLENYGYGSRKSAGKGQFLFRGPINESLQEVEDPDGFMTLSSSYVPNGEEFQQSRFTTHIKKGKIDGHVAATGKYLKKPIIMYESGSVFQTKHVQPFYGKVVKGIYEDREGHFPEKGIVQYGYAYPMKGKFFSKRNEQRKD